MDEDVPRRAPLGRVLGLVWLVSGGVAIAIGLFTTVAAISIFGVFAAVAGAGLIGLANLRQKSEARAARTLAGDPPPPSAAPFTVPPPARAPRDERGDEGYQMEDDEPRGERSDGGPRMDDDRPAPETSASGEAGTSGSPGGVRIRRAGSATSDPGTPASGPPRPQTRVSISEVEDGTGDVIPRQDGPR